MTIDSGAHATGCGENLHEEDDATGVPGLRGEKGLWREKPGRGVLLSSRQGGRAWRFLFLPLNLHGCLLVLVSNMSAKYLTNLATATRFRTSEPPNLLRRFKPFNPPLLPAPQVKAADGTLATLRAACEDRPCRPLSSNLRLATVFPPDLRIAPRLIPCFGLCLGDL